MKNIILALAISIFSMAAQAQQNAVKVVVSGKGNPVLLLPGFGCPGQVWDETAAHLSDHFQCHAVTYAGFGGVAPVDTLWLSSVEKSLERYIIDNHLKNVTIVGHSLGGTLGLMLCQSLKERVKQLVVVDMLPCIGMMMIPNYKPEYVTFDNPYNKQLLVMDAPSFEKMQKQMAANMCSDTANQQRIVKWMMQSDRKTYVYGYTELLKVDLRDAIQNIDQPVMVLAAGKYPSKEQILKIYDEQYAKLRHKTIKFIDGSAHFVMFDQPKVFISELDSFIGLK